ncbi:hypothetical protein GS896_27520 [Rhodococcus hoagii]|nr:hypothetical protein [Prescottella equi]MBM4654002.1 hypothetical protein [Prescottella equi]MBM4719735.1 hypothetical protein [Prescottella equi]NKR23532.1 hypothetical protein [Prescottella equi]NKT56314.1 hypothetical protein [Prescottella equi]
MERTEQEWDVLANWAEHQMELPIASSTARRGSSASHRCRAILARAEVASK